MRDDRHRWSRPLTVLVLTMLAMLTQAGPAFAHAELTSVQPADGAELATAPTTVLLAFDDAVEAVQGGTRVLDESGVPVPVGPARHPSGHPEQVSVALPTTLSPGTFVVDWRVVSDDGHPVQGSSSFSVGAVTRAARGPSSASGATPRTTAGASLVARLVALTGMVALLGGFCFLCRCWPAGWYDRRCRRVLVAAALATAAASGTQLLLQAAYAGGHGLLAAVDPDELSATVGTRVGALVAVRGLCALLVAVLLSRSSAGSGWPRWSAAALTVVLALATAASGHAGDDHDRAVAVAIDVVHLGAAAVWLGGLLMLLVGPLSARAGDVRGRTVFTRYSQMAATCVLLLVVTGVVEGVRRTGSLAALTQTSYGAALIVKTAVLATILTFAAGARQVVARRLEPAEGATQRPRPPARPAGGVSTLQRTGRRVSTSRQQPVDDGDVRRLRQSVGVELALGVVVLVVTAWLVALPPARSAYVPTSSTGRAVQSGTEGASSTK